MSHKDAEIARLRDALAREQAAHEGTRKMLADLIAKQPAPLFPLVPYQPPPVAPPWFDPLHPLGPSILPWPPIVTQPADHVTVTTYDTRPADGAGFPISH